MAFQDSPTSPSFPDYSQMIMAAIEDLDEKEGSSKEAITNYIESNYSDLPASHATHVTLTLEKLRQTGQLLMLKDDAYVLKSMTKSSDPTNGNGLSMPSKRGRRRPPKSKEPLPSGVVPSSPRPRGRPPKPIDPLAPVSRPTKYVSTGKPRGRPRKSPQGEGNEGPSPGPSGGVKRGRGRPKKS